MSAINDGGPAFPRHGSNWIGHDNQAMGCDAQPGMSLRDYFAAKALQGMLSDSRGINEETGEKFSIPDDADLIAYCCYNMADAMLKAREEGGSA